MGRGWRSCCSVDRWVGAVVGGSVDPLLRGGRTPVLVPVAGMRQSVCLLSHATDQTILTSGKSTQKALTFSPYRKLAKHSPKRARLSCMICRCMKFASRSAILSESSAKTGSSEAMEMEEMSVGRRLCEEERRELREGGRRGVMGCGGALLLWA